MWNDEITLLAERVVGKDRLSQDIRRMVRTKLFCRKKSITRSEFYQASQAGLRPSLVVDIHSFEYDQQGLAEYQGKVYRIIKTYPVGLEILELTLTEKLT